MMSPASPPRRACSVASAVKSTTLVVGVSAVGTMLVNGEKKSPRSAPLKLALPQMPTGEGQSAGATGLIVKVRATGMHLPAALAWPPTRMTAAPSASAYLASFFHTGVDLNMLLLLKFCASALRHLQGFCG